MRRVAGRLLAAACVLASAGRLAGPGIPLLARTASGALQGAVYYVDNMQPDADDTGPGSETVPWAHCPGMPGWSGVTVLAPGDTVYFDSAGTWTASSGNAVLQVAGGVTYDGSSWGSGRRATLRATGYIHRSVINFMEDHPTEPTVVRGFEADAGGQETSGICINWPQSDGSMVGAMKRIEDCVVHDTYSRSSQGTYEYGISISSGWGGSRQVSNVEVLDCEVYAISRGGINVYSANDDPLSGISDVLVRGNEIYATGQDPSYAGSGLALKNHVSNVIVEYNYVHDPHRGIGLGISTHPEPGFRGPENAVIRYNIITGSRHAGIYIQSHGDKSFEIYGNLIASNLYEGIHFAGSLADSLSARVYNNTLYNNHEPQWGHQIRVTSNSADISLLEVSNNILYSDADSRCLGDDDGDITSHSHNVYYRPGGGTLVWADGAYYSAATLASWEPAGLTADPELENSSRLPTGFTGTVGVDIEPDSDGLSITCGSPARNGGVDLGAAYSGSVNSVSRPYGAGWDIGAYEHGSGFKLYGSPGDEMIYLDWTICDPLPHTAVWHVSYYSTTAASIVVAADSLTHTAREYDVVGLANYAWYTVTLNAVDATPFLTATVRVMPTDIFVYLPQVLRGY